MVTLQLQLSPPGLIDSLHVTEPGTPACHLIRIGQLGLAYLYSTICGGASRSKTNEPEISSLFHSLKQGLWPISIFFLEHSRMIPGKANSLLCLLFEAQNSTQCMGQTRMDIKFSQYPTQMQQNGTNQVTKDLCIFKNISLQDRWQ